MADHRRVERVAEAIRENIATFLTNGVKDPRIVAHVTVTAVDCTPDLRHAKIFVSMLGSDTEKTSTLDALQGMKGHLRTRLSKALSLRVAPEVSFKMDETVARAARIESLLAEVREKKPSDGDAQP
jgi:ribosome-binding factor A